MDGSNGFTIPALADGSDFGFAIAPAGDVNGDGIDDVVLAAPAAIVDGLPTGAVWVLFGRSDGFPAEVDLTALDGERGFALHGVAADDRFGHELAGGDFNGDGYSDLILGSSGADVAYLVFGRESFTPVFEVSVLLPENGGDGSEGVVLTGEETTGESVVLDCDVNGDGFADAVVGAPEGPGLLRSGEGRGFVLFGSDVTPGATFDLLDLTIAGGGGGEGGFVVNPASITAFTATAESVGCFDYDADGLDDLYVDHRWTERDIFFQYWESLLRGYAIFGTREGFPAEIGLRDLDGVGEQVSSLYDVDIGKDFSIPTMVLANAGRFRGAEGASLVQGAIGEETPFYPPDDDAVYTRDLPDRTFVGGAFFSQGDGSGVAGAVDLNDDGWDDVAVGASLGDVSGIPDLGTVFVVYGRLDFDENLELADLVPELGGNGSDGFVLRGAEAGDRAGWRVAGAGDLNADGIGDLMVSAELGGSSGEVYVVFGRARPTLSFTGECPGELTATVSGLTPSSTVGLAGAAALGDSTVPRGPCAGTDLDLDQPRLLGLMRTDEHGEASLTRTVAPGLCGTYLQAVDEISCATTEAQALP